MADSLIFLQDLAVVTIIAALASVVFQRLRFPLVFGLLTAGVIIGPHTPPFSLIQDSGNLQTLSDLGVVLILFGLGLEFNLRTIRRVGLAAAAVMTIEVLLMLWLGFEVGSALGWSRLDSLFLGAMLSISSTAIIVSVLRELGRLNEESSRVVFAVLVLEDVAAILILVLLGGYAATGELPLKEASLVAGRMAVFLIAGLAIGLVAVPRILDAVAKRFRPEVSVLGILGLALGGAIASHLAGFHVGLGAFLAGAVAGEASHRKILEERFRPIHDLFAAVFFVSIGTLVDFSVLATYWRPVLLITIVIVVGKLLSGAIATFLAGYSPRTSVEVGASLAQIGEFSFVIAAVGLTTQTMSPFLFPIIVACAALTSFASPLLIRFGPGFAHVLGGTMPASLRTYASVYANWMNGLRAGAHRQTSAALEARRRSLLSAVLVIVVLAAAVLGQESALELLNRELNSSSLAGLVYWGAVLVLVVPLSFELTREVHRWTEAVQAANRPEGAAVGVRAVVRSTLNVLVAIVVGLPLLAASAPFISGPGVLIVWVAVVAIATILLAQGVRRLHRRLRENVESLIREENANVPIPDVVEAAVARGLAGPLVTDSVGLAQHSWACGRTIAETGLRTHTGATILLINRGQSQLGAGPSITLLPGDAVVVLGSRQQIEAARALLTKHVESGQVRPIVPGQLYVPEGSTMADKRLGESGVRPRYGLQIVAIQRGPLVLANPSPDERLLPGDVLIALGTERALVEAQHDMQSRPAAPTSSAPGDRPLNP